MTVLPISLGERLFLSGFSKLLLGSQGMLFSACPEFNRRKKRKKFAFLQIFYLHFANQKRPQQKNLMCLFSDGTEGIIWNSDQEIATEDGSKEACFSGDRLKNVPGTFISPDYGSAKNKIHEV